VSTSLELAVKSAPKVRHVVVMARLSSTSRDFFTNSKGVLAADKNIERAMKCGANAGIGFELRHGQIIEFFEQSETYLKFTEFTVNLKNGTREKRDVLSVSCEIDGKPQWLPVWALRKKPTRRSEFTSEMEKNQLYMTLQQESDNDWSRVEHLLGKDRKGGRYKVTEHKIDTSKNEKSFEVKVWTLEKVAATSSSGRGRKSSK
jgi:hypothetical protein